MLVPCFVEYTWGALLLAERMLDPGAYTSTHVPKLLNDDLASSSVVEPTETAPADDAGEVRHASLLDLPAAATTTTPDATAADTAELNMSFLEPPRLMLTTQGSEGFASQYDMTWLRPAIIPDQDPKPAAFRTLTEQSWQFPATP